MKSFKKYLLVLLLAALTLTLTACGETKSTKRSGAAKTIDFLTLKGDEFSIVGLPWDSTEEAGLTSLERICGVRLNRQEINSSSYHAYSAQLYGNAASPLSFQMAGDGMIISDVVVLVNNKENGLSVVSFYPYSEDGQMSSDDKMEAFANLMTCMEREFGVKVNVSLEIWKKSQAETAEDIQFVKSSREKAMGDFLSALSDGPAEVILKMSCAGTNLHASLKATKNGPTYNMTFNVDVSKPLDLR